MENKIILELIKKDIEELALLVGALQDETQLSDSLIRITTTKAQTLVNEFILLQSSTVATDENVTVLKAEELHSDTEKIQVKAENVKTEVIAESVQIVQPTKQAEIEISELEEISLPFKTIKTESESEPESEYERQPEPETMTEPEPESEPVISEPLAATPAFEQQVVSEPVVVTQSIIENNEPVIIKDLPEEKISALFEESSDQRNSKEKKVLGEIFTKELSLNERLAQNIQQESRIKARPITSLKGSIGLNDRFLYTRELFANDGQVFDQAILELDRSESLIEAITYLEKNFQWQKTETSLKFLDLIKRRFDN